MSFCTGKQLILAGAGAANMVSMILRFLKRVLPNGWPTIATGCVNCLLAIEQTGELVGVDLSVNEHEG